MKWVGRRVLLIRCNIAVAGIQKNGSFGTYPSETALQYPRILDYAVPVSNSTFWVWGSLDDALGEVG